MILGCRVRGRLKRWSSSCSRVWPSWKPRWRNEISGSPRVTEYQVVSRRCDGCGQVSEPTATDVPREITPDTGMDTADGEDSDDPGTAQPSAAHEGDEGAQASVALALRPGSPVRIGPR